MIAPETDRSTKQGEHGARPYVRRQFNYSVDDHQSGGGKPDAWLTKNPTKLFRLDGTLAIVAAQVVVSDIQDEEGEQVLQSIRAEGDDAIYVHYDVAVSVRWNCWSFPCVRRRYGRP